MHVQVRLTVSLKLYACNVVAFVLCQISTAMESGSVRHVILDMLGFIILGILLPIAVNWYNEVQARRAFVGKARNLSASRIGPYWLKHVT